MCKGNKGVGVLCSLQTGEPSTVNVGSAAMNTLLRGLQSVLSVVNTDILIYLTVSQTEKHYCHIWSLCTSTLLKVFVCVKSTGCFWTHNCRKEMQTDTKPLWIIPAFKIVTLLICDYFSCGGFNRKKKKSNKKQFLSNSSRSMSYWELSHKACWVFEVWASRCWPAGSWSALMRSATSLECCSEPHNTQ